MRGGVQRVKLYTIADFHILLEKILPKKNKLKTFFHLLSSKLNCSHSTLTQFLLFNVRFQDMKNKFKMLNKILLLINATCLSVSDPVAQHDRF